VATAQTTTFTYQGKLTDAGTPASGSYDLQFKLFDTVVVGTGVQQGSTVTVSNVTVASGIFAVQLDFGSSVFPGAARYLEIAVKPSSGPMFTVLAPRESITSIPYAIKSANAALADNLSTACVGCVKSTQIQSLPTDSTSYIHNQAGLQASSSFNISGNGLIGGNVGIGTTTPALVSGASGKMVSISDPLNPGIALTNTDAGGHQYFLYSSTANGSLRVFDATVGADRMILLDNGNLGIGGTDPLSGNKLEVDGAALFKPGGTGGGYMALHTPNGETGLTINGNGTTRADLRFDGAALKLVASTTGIPAATNGVSIATSGNVGIGTTSPGGKLGVKGNTTNFGIPIFAVSSSDDAVRFTVTDSGGIYIPTLGLGATAGHVCRNTGYLSPCASAAEYVPTVERDLAYPEAGDLVSIAGANPYGDDHSPFAVARSAKACDENLLGFLLKPELGADGIQLNDRYLPLAIYGYFPANVTMENGAIKRGDPITSSSKPGYGMKATQACRIIGYALEDADHEGRIQVFANLSESSAAHSPVEKPRLRDLYDGFVTTDANGEAEITLPAGFSPLHRDFRYQLTCIGAFAQAIVAEEIQNNRFKIRTSLPEVKVSWQITASLEGISAN